MTKIQWTPSKDGATQGLDGAIRRKWIQMGDQCWLEPGKIACVDSGGVIVFDPNSKSAIPVMRQQVGGRSPTELRAVARRYLITSGLLTFQQADAITGPFTLEEVRNGDPE